MGSMKEIETTTGRAATDEEIAQKLEISTDDFADWQSQMKITGVVSLNEFMESGSEIPAEQHNQHRFEEPEEVIEKEELKEVLGQALELLTEKEKKVILLYYYEDLTLKEISNVLEVSESRVSQLHTKALKKMKEELKPHGLYEATTSWDNNYPEGESAKLKWLGTRTVFNIILFNKFQEIEE